MPRLVPEALSHNHSPQRQVERVRISEAEVRPGNALDALRASLAANAEHGKRREPGDYRRAYDVTVRNRLVEPTDIEAITAA